MTSTHPAAAPPRLRALVAVMALAIGCHGTTAALPADLEARFQREGVVRRADDQTFRYTYYSRSTRGSRWEDRAASIIITSRTVFIHKNGKVGLELTAASRKATEVRRDGDRVIIGAGSGQSKVSWSFRPPDDAEGWARDVRAVLGGTGAAADSTPAP